MTQEFTDIAAQLRSGAVPEEHTTRELLGWKNVSRRGRHVIATIRKELRASGLKTRPDFEYAYIDELLTFSLDDENLDEVAPGASAALPPDPTVLAGAAADPIYRIAMLGSANSKPVSVTPHATISEAITTMLFHDFSQLPVMNGERDLKGAVSWRSIGRSLALGHKCESVRDCMEHATTISSETSLFEAIPTIAANEYVFVADDTRRIVGIVTTTDLSLQFRQLAESFLLLGEIENHLRHLSDRKFKPSELMTVRDPNDQSRAIEDLSDLTFGEHLRLLENPERWQALGLSIDRGVFVKHLNAVRVIRNDVMHFDPDGVDPAELQHLRNFSRLLSSLRARAND